MVKNILIEESDNLLRLISEEELKEIEDSAEEFDGFTGIRVVGRVDNTGIIKDIKQERLKQDAKWGEQNYHPYKWLAILGEEVGEANKAILEGSLMQYHDEMVQVAAVAVAALECLQRGE